MEQKEKDGVKAGKSDEDVLKGLAASIQPVVSSGNKNAGAVPRVPGIPAVIPPMAAMPPIPSKVSDVQQYMRDLEIIRQGAEAEFDLHQKTHTSQTLQTYGELEVEETPIYREFRENRIGLQRKLNTIIKTIQIPEDYNEDREIPFPPYSSILKNYTGGRYDAHGAKIRYPNNTHMFDRYEEQPFLNEAERIARIKRSEAEAEAKEESAKTKTKVVTNATNVPAAQRPAAAQPKVKVVPVDPSDRGNQFVYQPTSKTETILGWIKELNGYIIKGELPPDNKIPSKHVKTSVVVEDVNGKKHNEMKYVNIYLQDDVFKEGTLVSLMGRMNIPGLVFETEEVGKAGSSSERAGYKEVYIVVSKMEEILDYLLGRNNWTMEFSNSVRIDKDTQVIRGYYLDVLGNFMYGQYVSDSKIGSGGSGIESAMAGRRDAMISNLKRTLISDVFKALRGVNAKYLQDIYKAQDQLSKARQQAGAKAVNKYKQEQKENDYKEKELDIKRQQLEYLQKYDLPKLLERVTDQPLKLLGDLASEPLQGVKRPPEEKEEVPEKRHVTTEEADFKDITISKPKGTKEDGEKEA